MVEIVGWIWMFLRRVHRPLHMPNWVLSLVLSLVLRLSQLAKGSMVILQVDESSFKQEHMLRQLSILGPSEVPASIICGTNKAPLHGGF